MMYLKDNSSFSEHSNSYNEFLFLIKKIISFTDYEFQDFLLTIDCDEYEFLYFQVIS